MEKIRQYLHNFKPYVTVRSCISLIIFLCSLIGAILLLVAVANLENVPISKICTQQGYSSYDCDSTEQAYFSFKSNPSCLLVNTPSCQNRPARCCTGPQNINNSWRTPLGTNQVTLNVPSCRNYARSVRAGFKRCGNSPPPCPSNGTIISVSSSVLDNVESIALHECMKDRVNGGYFILYITGPLALCVCLALGLGVCTSSESLVRMGMFLGTVAIAMLLEGLRTLLSLKHGLGWEGAIECQGLVQQYVVNGTFLSSFHCVDVTIGGRHSRDPNYAWLEQNLLNYYIGFGFVIMGLVLLIAMLFSPALKTPPQASIRLGRIGDPTPLLESR